jgi:tetratricopeptide (TPR) repeat protein
VLSIGEHILEAEILTQQKKYDKAIQLLSKAVEIEDNLLYQEPPDWYHPSRQILGNVLLEAGKPVEAEKKFREDLNQYRNNGWSLYGLFKSLEAQGKVKEAQTVKQQYEVAFAKADINLATSKF